MAPLDQSFIKAYTSESSIDTLQPIRPTQEDPSGPVPAPHARFRPAHPKTIVSRPVAGETAAAATAKIGRSDNGSSGIDRSGIDRSGVDRLGIDRSGIDRSELFTAWTTTIASDQASIVPPAVSPKPERQIAIDDDVEVPSDDDSLHHEFQHDTEQPVSIPIPLPSRNAHVALRPELEVDRFVWASQIETLERLDKINDLIDTLADSSAAGDNVLVIAGQQRASGVSTLVLAAARALANMGLRVAVVDANFEKPALAPMLGIAPPAGWEDVFARQCPLSEVLVESLEDGLVLMPLADRVDRELLAQSEAAIGETLRALRLEFDVVLVDGGACREGGDDHTAGDLLTSDDIDILRLAADDIDAVVCVRDGRAEPVTQSVTRPRRKSGNVRQLGVVENFTL